MTIVGIQDIGPLWPREGKAVAYHWPVYIHAARLIIPLVLLALLLLRPNRARGAWWALLPPLVLPVLVLWIAEKMGESEISDALGFVGDNITLFFFALAFLWLTSYRLGNLPRLHTFTQALGTLVLAGSIGLVGVSFFGFDATLILKAFVYAMFIFVFLAAMALAAFMSRKRYTPLRFLFRFFIILVVGIAAVGTALSVLLMMVVGVIMGGGLGIRYLAPMVVGQMTVSAFTGLVLFLLVLPFLALALWCPVYRQRFHAIFRLPGTQPTDDSGYNDPMLESPATEDNSLSADEPPETTDGL